MKKIFLITSVLFLSNFSFAKIILSNTVVFNSFPKDNIPHSLYATIFNNTPNTDTVLWSKLSEQLLSGWTAISLCDPCACFPFSDTSTHTFILAPGDSGFLYIDMKASPTAANGASFVTLATNHGNIVFRFETALMSCNSGFYVYEDSIAAPHTYIGVNTSTGSIVTYDWSWGGGTPNSSAPYPSHTYAASGNYTICLTVSDGTGCVDSFCSHEIINKTLADMLSVNFAAYRHPGRKRFLY